VPGVTTLHWVPDPRSSPQQRPCSRLREGGDGVEISTKLLQPLVANWQTAPTPCGMEKQRG